MSSAAKRGLGGKKYVSFRYDIFEKYFLRFVKQLKPADLLPHSVDTTETDISRIEGEIADTTNRIGVVRNRITTDPDFSALLDILRDLEQRQQNLTDQLDKLHQQGRRNDRETIKETKSIVDMLAEAEDPTDLRTRLRAQIRQLVDGIQFQPFTAKMDGQEWRCMIAAIRFRSGAERRLVVAYRRGQEEWETFASEDGVYYHHNPKSLVNRLHLVPTPEENRASLARRRGHTDPTSKVT